MSHCEDVLTGKGPRLSLREEIAADARRLLSEHRPAGLNVGGGVSANTTTNTTNTIVLGEVASKAIARFFDAAAVAVLVVAFAAAWGML